MSKLSMKQLDSRLKGLETSFNSLEVNIPRINNKIQGNVLKISSINTYLDNQKKLKNKKRVKFEDNLVLFVYFTLTFILGGIFGIMFF